MFVPSVCAPNQVIRGFTLSGILLCVVPTAVISPCTYGGPGNTCLGSGALDSSNNPAAVNNTAIGFESLTNNNTGDGNTALGYQTLYTLNGNANNNTALGSVA